MPEGVSLVKWQPTEGEIKIFDPEYISYCFGPNDEIRFGPKGGFDEHIWIGPGDHPMLEDLLNDRPELQVVTEEKQVFVCLECSPETKWGSMQAYKAHQSRTHRSTVVTGVVTVTAKGNVPVKE